MTEYFLIAMTAKGSPYGQFITYEDAWKLMEQGWMAADLHVHTICSPDVLPSPNLHPEVLYKKAINMGMGYVTFTDHDTMRPHLLLGARERLISGVEIKIKDNELVGHTIHVNVYDLDLDQFQDLEGIAKAGDLLAFVEYLKEMDLPYTYNHPFWFEPGEEPNLRIIPEIVNLFPVIEYNMHRVRRKNELAMDLSRRKGKGLVAATDTHSGMIAKVYTLAKGDTFHEYFKNVASGDAFLAASHLTKEDLIQEVNTWIDNIFNPETMNREMSNFYTGIDYVDKLAKTLSSETLRGFPRILRVVERLSYRISYSGLLASIYLHKENSLLPEIEEQMAFLFEEDKIALNIFNC